MILPTSEKMGRWAKDRVIDQCRVSVGPRRQLARSINQWRYAGSDGGQQAIFNRLFVHGDKLASAVFSPADLRFQVEYENDYGSEFTARAKVAGRYLSREVAQRNLDLGFQEGVEEAVPFGCTILKHIWTHHGPDVTTLMPWQFGVYLESETDLDKQEAMVETTYLLRWDAKQNGASRGARVKRLQAPRAVRLEPR